MVSLRSMCVKALGLAMALAGILVAGESTAQSISQPPLLQTSDSNGVNLADGSFLLPGPDLGVGAGGSGLARKTQNRVFAGMTTTVDNYSGVIAPKSVTVSYTPSGGRATPSKGARTQPRSRPAASASPI